MHLVFDGNKFEEGKSLYDYKIHKDSTLYMVLCICGGIHIFVERLTSKATDIDINKNQFFFKTLNGR